MNEGPKNRLGAKQTYQLTGWVQKQGKTKVREASDDALAKEAAETLGFAVTRSNIIGAREVLGWHKLGGSTPLIKRRATKRELVIIGEALANLYTHLGEPVPVELAQVIAKVNEASK